MALAGRAFLACAVTDLAGTLRHDPRATICAAPWLAAGALLGRGIAYTAIRTVRRRRLVSHRAVILGAGRVGGEITRILLNHPEYGLRPMGFLDDVPLLAAGEAPVPVLGGTRMLADVLGAKRATVVIVAFTLADESELLEVIRTCDRFVCEIFLVPRLYELGVYSGDVDDLRGVPLVRLRRAAFHSPMRHVKRILDVVLSGALLVFLAPFLAVVAIAVRLSTGPGVLFRQERVGVDGERFVMLKFTSLRPLDVTESEQQWSICGDSRLRPWGRFIRRTSLDELPQLVNVLLGHMSLVGPRPERPHFAKAFGDAYPHYSARHRVPSGLTGLAQVHGLRGDTSISERARLDNAYIERWSLSLDMKIILRTVAHLLATPSR